MNNGMNIDMHNLVSSDEVYNIIKTSAETLIANPDLAGALPAIMLRGAPGVGKSTIVRSESDSSMSVSLRWNESILPVFRRSRMA